MARVTVEDCIDKAATRFELVMAAAQRARQLAAGVAPTLPRENDKNPVIALREIAENTVEVPVMAAELLRAHRRVATHEEDEEEAAVDLSGGQEAWEELAAKAAAEDSHLESDAEEDEEEE